MKHELHDYTPFDSRGLVYNGKFEITDDINIGDWILVHHVCAVTKVPLLMKVRSKKIAYYFQGEPVYDYCVVNGGSYKCNLKHISIYDQIVKDETENWTELLNKYRRG